MSDEDNSFNVTRRTLIATATFVPLAALPLPRRRRQPLSRRAN